jgi:hypothetical protein
MKGMGIKFSCMMRKSIVRGPLFLIALLLVLGGCKERDLRFKIRYDVPQGLEKGGRVVFLGDRIGEVSRISDTENGYLVEVSIQEKYRDTVTEHARFFVVEDPDHRGKSAIQMIALRKGGHPLEQDTIVHGSADTVGAQGRLWEELDRGLDDLKKDFDTFSRGLQKIPKSEEFKQLQRELERLSEEMKQSGKAAKDKLEKEVLPKLKGEIEKFRRWLERVREEHPKPLEV